LAPLDTARWRRLEDQRRKLKSELREAYARQQRLLRQIDFVEEEQRVMVDGELQNLESLQAEKASSPGLFPDPFIDVASEQIVFPNASKGWSFTSLAPLNGSLEMLVENVVDETAPACSGTSSSS